MHISELSVKRPVASLMFFLAVLMIGIISLSKLSVDLLPSLSFPKLTVWTKYTGAAPREVEEFISKPVEGIVSTISGIKKISSVSKEGVSLVTIEFFWGTDMDAVTLNMREKLDQLRLSTSYQNVSRPTIIRVDPSSQPIMSLALSGDNLIDLKETASSIVKRRLEQIKGVAIAGVTGGLEREIKVYLNKTVIDNLNIPISSISSALRTANFSVTGGTIKKGRFRFSIRTFGEFESLEDLNEVVVHRLQNGRQVKIKDIAEIEDGFKERDSITRLSKDESIGVLIYKESGSNTVKVTDEIKDILAQLKEEHPDLEVKISYEEASFITNSINNVLEAILLGGVLAFLVLFLFLHNARNPINIGIAIPLSVIATFSLLYFAGISLNMISLGGLALGVGMLVDNSIVVLENIHRHREEGSSLITASVTGAKEVSMAVTASTLTTISVFFPIVFVEGVAGQLFKQQSITVSFSLLVSLLVSLTLLPMLAAHFLSGTYKAGKIEYEKRPSKGFRERKFFSRLLFLIIYPFKFIYFSLKDFVIIIKILLEKFFSLLNRIFTPVFKKFDEVFGKFVEKYKGFLEYALDNKAKIVTGFILVVVVTLVLGVFLGREILPEVDQRQFYVTFKLPEGSTLEAADETALDIIDRLNELQGIETIFSNIGITKEQNIAAGEAVINSGNVFVKIADNGPDTDHVIEHVDDLLKNYGGLDYSFKTSENTLSKFLAGSEWDISIKIFGEDFAVSRTLINELTGKVENIGGVRTVSYSYKEGKPEIRLKIDKDKTNMFGVSAQSVANIVKNYLQGDIATQFNVFDKKVDILVTAEENSKTSIEDLLENFIPAGENIVPLREFVNVEYASGPNEIIRESQARYISINADVEGRDLAAVIGDIENIVNNIEVPRGYKIVIGGENEEVQRSFNSLVMALLIAMALVYMIMAAQFESLLHPFTIMFSIPMAFVGVIVILFVCGQTLNVMSGIGLIILFGIAVNDSIIMVDFINQRRREGMELKEAVIDSGLKRIRPILMTTITTILGLLPMAVGFGAGAELRKPLALTVIGGLFTATVLTLIIIPVLYTILENIKTAVIKKK